MQKSIRYQTYDGKWHDSQHEARRHLEQVYGNKLCSLAARINTIAGKPPTENTHGRRELPVAILKYGVHAYHELQTFIDEHLDEFLELDRIKRDMASVDEDDE